LASAQNAQSLKLAYRSVALRLFRFRGLHTTDLRSVLAAVAAAQLGARDVGKLFPGFSGQPLVWLFT
jgi:hypothetical protein